MKDLMKQPLLGLALYFSVAAPGLCQVPGTQLWHVTTPSSIVSSPAIAADGTIYVGSAAWTVDQLGSLCSFSREGTTNWILNFPGGVFSSPSIGPDGRVYVGRFTGELLIVSPTGSYSSFATGGNITASPAVAADGTVYIPSVSNLFNKLFAFTADGEVKWSFEMQPVVSSGWNSLQSSSPAIGPDGTIYVGSIDMNLYAINPNGTTNWVFPLGAPTYASPAIGPDGTIYIGADNGTAYAVKPNGVAKWVIPLSSGRIESSAAVSGDGTVYFGSVSEHLFALAPDGALKWTYHDFMGFSGSPALADNGTIYAPLYMTTYPLVAVSPWGTNSWRFWYNQTDAFSSPAIGPDGTVYFAAYNRLFAVYGTNTLMHSSWPMFRANPSHTARAIQRGISSPVVLADGNVRLNVNVETGRTYQLETSTDGFGWGVLTNFVSESCSYQVVDWTATNSPTRFYRLNIGSE